MKILVPIKRVPDPSVPLRLAPDGTGLAADAVRMVINPFDEVALEQALRLRDAGLASEVIVATIGAEAATDVLRTGLALGADRALLVVAEGAISGLAVARQLALVARAYEVRLVLLGKQSTDEQTGQVGPCLAALLDWGFAGPAASVVLAGDRLTAVCDVDRGTTTLDLALPAVVSAELRLAETRYATLPNIMKAKTKPLARQKLADFPDAAAFPVAGLREPDRRPPPMRVGSVEELADHIRARLRAQGGV